MNLTDKREHVFHHGTLYEGESIKKIIAEQDKEFIQKLKKIKIDILEATGRLSREYMIECYEKEIDKLAGDKLTENST